MNYTHNINKYFFFIFFAFHIVLHAQDAQQIQNQLKNTGFSSDQTKEIIKSQELNIDQIYRDNKKSNLDKKVFDSNDIQTVNDINDVKLEDDQINTKQILESDEDKLVYFGYNIFDANPEAFQASTFGAVDPAYNIGPGDQIIVMLWGESQFRQEFTIDREGYVFVPEVGQVFVNGLNLKDLEKKFFQILSKVYSTLNPSSGKPTTFMDISIGNLRPLRIIVLGEISQPGSYSISPSTSLSSSLYYFGGPTTSGSLREIRLIRSGNKIGTIDFYDYLLSGKTPEDLRLQLDDIVFVPPRGKTTTIIGEINRPGIYELKENEGLKDLINIAGNLKVTAYTNRVQINRIIPNQDRLDMGMDRMIVDIDLDKLFLGDSNVDLFDGDTIKIFPIEDLYKNYVSIFSNSVMRPGKYQLIPGMRVKNIINIADGVLNDAFLDKAHISRINDDLTRELIAINLKSALDGNLVDNIELKSLDQLFIYNNNELKNNFTTVNLNGPLKNPGFFPYEKDINLGDLILKAGGFLKSINKVKITISRIDMNSYNPIIYNFPRSKNYKYININMLEDKNNEINRFVLQPYDNINIYADPKDNLPINVHILGEVLYPGSYTIISNKEKISDIIKRAGGFSRLAYPKASVFIRNGNQVRLSFEKIISNPKSKENFTVFENDTIFINKRTNLVYVSGEVNQPGFYKFQEGLNLRDYLSTAGGLTINAERREIWITYPDGRNKQLKRFGLAPKVFDDSIINVGLKEESDPLDKTEFAKEVASIVSDFLQIALTLSILSKN